MHQTHARDKSHILYVSVNVSAFLKLENNSSCKSVKESEVSTKISIWNKVE